jgi:sugar phosphate isomerase/epimerase
LIGLNTYAFKWALGKRDQTDSFEAYDIRNVIEDAAGMDVRLLQICDNYPLNQMSETALTDTLSAAKEKGVMLEVGTRGVERTVLKEYLRIAQRMEARLVRTLIHTGNGQCPIPHCIKEELAAVAREYEDAGVCIAIENYEAMPSKVLAGVIKDMASDVIGVCLDTGNNLGNTERPEETVETLAPYAKSLHLKDYAIVRTIHNNGFVIEGRPLGSGVLDIDYVFDVLDGYGISVNTIIEHWVPSTAPLYNMVATERKWVERSLAYLRRYLGERARQTA